MSRLPSYYIPHGAGPCFFMDWDPKDTWTALANWLKGLHKELPGRPKAFLVISAHWEESEFTLLNKPNPSLYYDYYGFPEHCYELEWPAKAAPSFLARVQELCSAAGVQLLADAQRDFDHGVFIPGLLMFPKADIPTLQISLRKGLSPLAHLELGKALAPLRDEGVLIIGSGMSFHNLGAFRWGDNEPIPGAELFDNWLTETITLQDKQKREERLVNWENSPNALMCHPHADHFIPLLTVAGTASEQPGRLAFHCRAMGAPLSAYSFA